ncbi:cupin domain-containing protein [Fontisphaera persica]|uniref:cupin domain-containing protein n=1 Tax=Fontisphaera persica TaxID=2974023 RepID=UPI0024BFD9CF|nr:cupin domain-containing protein [Fontisphaera persica]WCJ60066.1 cupin domain-containing protein [Fontisphaera persica]
MKTNHPKPAPGRPTLVRHEAEAPRERSACGWRCRLISREDAALGPAAWAHAVDIDGAKPHYHLRSTEIYYVLEGSGAVVLDGVEHQVTQGSLVHIPPGVVHGARGRMRVLVIGIPDIAEDDYFEPTASEPSAPAG